MGAIQRALVGLSTVLLAAPGLAVAAAAEERPVVEVILEVLRASGQIDDAQHRALLEQARREEASRARAREAVNAPARGGRDGEVWSVGWNNGFFLENEAAGLSLRWGGRIHLDAAAIEPEADLRAGLDAFGLGDAQGTGVAFRRARLFFRGAFYERGIFRAEYDFAGGGDPQFEDVWVGLQDLPVVGRIRAGHTKEPFSIQQMESANHIAFIERALSDALVPARNTGILFDRTLLDERVHVAVGAFRDVDDFAGGFGNAALYNVTGRLTGLPVDADEGRRLLHVGVAYSRQFRDGETLRYRTRPEVSLGARFADTGRIEDVDGVDLLGGELAGVWGPLHFTGELVGARVARGGAGDPSFWGGYAQLGWFLTGEHRAYDREDAVFDRTAPRRPWDPDSGGFGAFELLLRYSYLDLVDEGVRGGQLRDVTVGLNWILFPNLRLMTNYVYADRVGLGSAHLAQMRLSLDF